MNSSLFFYYIDLGLRSLRRNIVLTALLIVAIGVGVGTSIHTSTVFRAMSGDPHPSTSRAGSSRRRSTAVDLSFLPAPTDDHLQTSMAYTDAMALMRAKSAPAGAKPPCNAPSCRCIRDLETKSSGALAHAVYAELSFPCSTQAILVRQSWTAAEDDDRAATVVLNEGHERAALRRQKQRRENGRPSWRRYVHGGRRARRMAVHSRGLRLWIGRVSPAETRCSCQWRGAVDKQMAGGRQRVLPSGPPGGLRVAAAVGLRVAGKLGGICNGPCRRA